MVFQKSSMVFKSDWNTKLSYMLFNAATYDATVYITNYTSLIRATIAFYCYFKMYLIN